MNANIAIEPIFQGMYSAIQLAIQDNNDEGLIKILKEGLIEAMEMGIERFPERRIPTDEEKKEWEADERRADFVRLLHSVLPMMILENMKRETYNEHALKEMVDRAIEGLLYLTHRIEKMKF